MLVKKVKQSGKDWDIHLPFVLFAYRASLQESTKESPFHLLYGHDPKLPTALELGGTLLPEKNLETCKGEVSEAWKLARNNIKKAQQHQKQQYDPKMRLPKFGVGG